MNRQLQGYQELAVTFRRQVAEGTWQIGGVIPSEAALAKTYGVAVGTIRQAIQKLVDEGVLIKRHGKSTTVSSGLSGQSMLRFFRYQLDPGNQLTPQGKVLDAKEISIDKAMTHLTGWTNKTVLKILRQRLIHDVPLLYEVIYLPLPQFDNIAKLKLQEFEDLLYPMYARLCGVAVLKAKDQVSFEFMQKNEANALGMKEGHPAVRVNRIALDISGQIVEYRSSIGDAMAFHYSAEVN